MPNRLPFWGLIVFIALTGCALNQSVHEREPQIQNILNKMSSAFETERAADLFDSFDRAGFPAFEIEREKINEFFLRSQQIVLDLSADKTLTEGDNMIVYINWSRSWVDESGNFRLKEGSCSMHFNARPSGGWALKLIKGESPFIH